MSSCSRLLIGTRRMCGRRATLQIHSASRASFVPGGLHERTDELGLDQPHLEAEVAKPTVPDPRNRAANANFIAWNEPVVASIPMLHALRTVDLNGIHQRIGRPSRDRQHTVSTRAAGGAMSSLGVHTDRIAPNHAGAEMAESIPVADAGRHAALWPACRGLPVPREPLLGRRRLTCSPT
jgi:hypothetical protein